MASEMDAWKGRVIHFEVQLVQSRSSALLRAGEASFSR